MISQNRLITQNAQDPHDDHYAATYIRKNIHNITLGGILFFSVVIGLFSSTGSQAYNKNSVHMNQENSSSNMPVLASAFTVLIPDAIGGPSDIVTNENALVSQIALLEDGSSGRAVIEDTNGISLYIVREGDTLSEIAELFDVTTNTIKWENNLGKTLKVGQELRILPVSGVSHTIKKGDTYAKIAKTYDVEIDDITIFNDLDAKKLTVGQKIIVPNGVIQQATVKTSSVTKKSNTVVSSKTNSSSKVQGGYYIRPTGGRTSSTFGPRSGSYHYGIDFATPIGTPVVAAASGTVVKTSCGNGYGICTVIQHDNGTQTLYAHNSKLFVSAGSQVKQGQKIANSGNSGRSSGPHLHFEIQDSRTGAKKNPNFLK